MIFVIFVFLWNKKYALWEKNAAHALSKLVEKVLAQYADACVLPLFVPARLEKSRLLDKRANFPSYEIIIIE